MGLPVSPKLLGDRDRRVGVRDEEDGRRARGRDLSVPLDRDRTGLDRYAVVDLREPRGRAPFLVTQDGSVLAERERSGKGNRVRAIGERKARADLCRAVRPVLPDHSLVADLLLKLVEAEELRLA